MSSNAVRATEPAPLSGTAQVFATCPSSFMAPERYIERIREVAQWSEAAGCTGILIYTDNTLADPWAVAQVVIQSTSVLSPLVAVQPLYMHPYAAAKMVASLGMLYDRRIFLNMVAGGFRNDLLSLDDQTPHDRRYDRLVEYTQVVRALLESPSPVSFEGEFYHIRNAVFHPHLRPELVSGILVSGSSEAGMKAARAMGAIAVKYPEPPERCGPRLDSESPCGIRIGIVARMTEEEAWAVAEARFPRDRKGQLARQLATKVSDSNWHHRLTQLGNGGAKGPYWLHPFENYQTNCPYLVGSYERVAAELSRYRQAGFETFILDIPAAEEEFEHIAAVFHLAFRSVAA